MLIIAVLQMLMNVLKANTIAVQVHTAMTQLEGFSVPVNMDTLEMDIVAVCCAVLNSLLQVICVAQLEFSLPQIALTVRFD